MKAGTWLGAALVLGACATATVAAADSKFDGRGWTVGNQQRSGTQSLTEYVLPGQTVDNWKELVTSTVFFQPVPLSVLVERIHSSMSQGCPSLVFKVIRQDDKTALFEWRDAGCGGFEPQNELDRIAVEPDGLYRLAYAIKVKGPLPAAKREQWLAILNQVPPAEGSSLGAKPTAARPAPSAAAAGTSTPPAKKLSTAELVAGVRKSGWPCPAGTKSEVKSQLPGPQGMLTQYTLDCSNAQTYTVLVDPSGGMTAFQLPK